MKRSKLPLIVAIIVGVILIAGGIVALILINSKSEEPAPSPTPEEEIRETFGENASLITDNEFSELDIADDRIEYYDVESKLQAMISGAKIYADCAATDVDCVIKNVDQMVKDNNITDGHQLLLIDFEKAKLFSNYGAPERAWAILGFVREENLLKNEFHAYYHAMTTYYGAVGDEPMRALYYDKMRSVAVEDWG